MPIPPDAIARPGEFELTAGRDTGTLDGPLPEAVYLPTSTTAFETTEGQPEQQVTDREVAALLIATSEQLGAEQVDRILSANQDFNGSGRSVRDTTDGQVYHDPHYSNRRLLRELVPLADAADQLGANPKSVADAVAHTLDQVWYKEYTHSDLLVAQLADTFGNLAQCRQPLTSEDIADLQTLATEAAGAGGLQEALMIVRAATATGATLHEGVHLARQQVVSTGASILRSQANDMVGALQALNVVRPLSSFTGEIFDALAAVDFRERPEAYQLFRRIMGFVGPASGRSALETVASIINYTRETHSIQEALHRVVSDSNRLESTSVIHPELARDRYFTPHRGELVHSITPYRTGRRLNDGVRDLERLTFASRPRGDIVAEGAWVFDPAINTWYSLGGETERINAIGESPQVRVTVVPYDVSMLSDTPLLFHMHPDGFTPEEHDKVGFAFPTSVDIAAAGAMEQSAERPVPLRSFIAHPLGITEYTHPADNDAIQQVAGGFDALRDQVIATMFTSHDHLRRAVAEQGAERITRKLIAEINGYLPEGFSIIMYPQGADMEAIIDGN